MMIAHNRDSDSMPSPVPPTPTAIINSNEGKKREKKTSMVIRPTFFYGQQRREGSELSLGDVKPRPTFFSGNRVEESLIRAPLIIDHLRYLAHSWFN